MKRTDYFDVNGAYRKAFEADTTGKAVMAPDGRWLLVNQAIKRILLDRADDEWVSHCFQDLLPASLFQQLTRKPEDQISLEYAFRKPGGRTVYCSFQVTRIRDEAGRPAYYIMQVQDATNRKLNEKEIQKLHHVNHLILNSVDEGIFGVDLESNIIFWNRAAERLTGYGKRDFDNANLHDLIHHTNKEGIRIPYDDCPVTQALKGGSSLQVSDDVFWRKDGTSFPVEYSINPIMENGIYVGTVITFSDITEKLHNNELMLRSEKLTIAGQLAAGVAHEIRNPLTSLKGFLQLMYEDPSKVHSYFGIMQDELIRIDSILSELLLLAKPQAKRYKRRNLNDVLGQVVLLLNTQAILQGVEIRCAFPDVECAFECDDHQMKQLFINLLKNAIESMENGGVITIRVTRQIEHIAVQIIDQGCGIPEERVKRLGEPFYTTKERGTGLGLMVSFKIVEHHNGTMKIDSEVGKGTTFTITFPAAK